MLYKDQRRSLPKCLCCISSSNKNILSHRILPVVGGALCLDLGCFHRCVAVSHFNFHDQYMILNIFYMLNSFICILFLPLHLFILCMHMCMLASAAGRIQVSVLLTSEAGCLSLNLELTDGAGLAGLQASEALGLQIVPSPSHLALNWVLGI